MSSSESGDARQTRNTNINHTASQIGVGAAQNEAAASDAMRAGMEAFLKKAGAVEKVGVGQKKGNFFEYIEAAKFNTDAARKGSDLYAVVTDANGSPHDAADLLVEKGPDVIREVQAKANREEELLAYEVAQEKYETMMRLMPEDKIESVREVMDRRIEMRTSRTDDYSEARDHLSGELDLGDIRSGGTSHEELLRAASDPSGYAFEARVDAAAAEGITKGGQAAGVSFVLTAVWYGILNGNKVFQGEVSSREAIQKTGGDSLKNGGRGALVGAGGTVIRNAAAEMGVEVLSKTAVANSFAAATINLGVITYELIRGDITPEQAVERAGQTTSSTLSAVYVGAAAGALFGPPGMLIGSTAGYFVANTTYQSTLAILKEADLAEEEAARAIALSEEACELMRIQRLEFEEHFEAVTNRRAEAFRSHFDRIDESMREGDVNMVVSQLSDFAVDLGGELRYADFQEFHQFMSSNDGPLKL